MLTPVQITFRNMNPSAAVDAAIRERAEKLDRFHPGIIACRVAVEAARHRHIKGSIYDVRVDVTVPGGEIVARSETAAPTPHENVFVAVRDAFDEARRRLEDHARRLRGEVKSHTSRRAG